MYQDKVTSKKDVCTDVKNIPAHTQQQTLGKIAGQHAHTYTSLMFLITQERETNDALLVVDVWLPTVAHVNIVSINQNLVARVSKNNAV